MRGRGAWEAGAGAMGGAEGRAEPPLALAGGLADCRTSGPQERSVLWGSASFNSVKQADAGVPSAPGT